MKPKDWLTKLVPATALLWLLFLAAGVLLYFDYHAAAVLSPILRYPIAAIGVIVLAIGMYAFALLARYENILRGTLKNAAVFSAMHFPRTLVMVLFAVGLWLVCVRYYNYGTPILFLFGLSLPCYISALMLNGVFHKLDNDDRCDKRFYDI